MLFVTCSKGEFWDVPCISWHEMLVSHLVVFREEVTYNEVKHLLWRCLLRWTLFLTSFASCHEDVFWEWPLYKMSWNATCHEAVFWEDPCTKCPEMLLVMKVCFETTLVQNVVKCWLSWRCVLRWPLYKMSWNATCHEAVFWNWPLYKISWNATCHEGVFWDDPCTKCREMLLVTKLCFEKTPVQNVLKCYLSWRCVLRRPLYKMLWNATCHEGMFWDDPCTKCREMLLVMKVCWQVFLLRWFGLESMRHWTIDLGLQIMDCRKSHDCFWNWLDKQELPISESQTEDKLTLFIFTF